MQEDCWRIRPIVVNVDAHVSRGLCRILVLSGPGTRANGLAIAGFVKTSEGVVKLVTDLGKQAAQLRGFLSAGVLTLSSTQKRTSWRCRVSSGAASSALA